MIVFCFRNYISHYTLFCFFVKFIFFSLPCLTVSVYHDTMQPQNNPYDFITTPASSPKKSLFGGGGGKQKIILVVGGLSIITLFLVVIASLFGGPGTKDYYLRAVQQHAEMIRITELGSASARDNEAQNLAITTRQTLQSQQTDLHNLAIAAGINKIEPKILEPGKDITTDEKLTTADQLNRFDEEFIAIIKEQLAAYQETLSIIYDNTRSEATKETLSSMYDESALLIGNIPQSTTGGSEETPATN